MNSNNNLYKSNLLNADCSSDGSCFVNVHVVFAQDCTTMHALTAPYRS